MIKHNMMPWWQVQLDVAAEFGSPIVNDHGLPMRLQVHNLHSMIVVVAYKDQGSLTTHSHFLYRYYPIHITIHIIPLFFCQICSIAHDSFPLFLLYSWIIMYLSSSMFGKLKRLHANLTLALLLCIITLSTTPPRRPRIVKHIDIIIKEHFRRRMVIAQRQLTWKAGS